MSGSDSSRISRARAVADAGGVTEAVDAGTLAQYQDLSLSEALILGLLVQGVKKYIGVFGHGSTDLGEALRVYEQAGVVRVFNVRNEVEASHAATALRWHYHETAAVFTSIGPGALHALAGSLVPQSNGMGVYYLFGDETTHDEGFNMQQIPRHEQLSFLKLTSVMGTAYALHTAEALPAALRRGANTVFNPQQAGPCYLLMPMNVQGQIVRQFNLLELPRKPRFFPVAPGGDTAYEEALRLISDCGRILVKAGNGARGVDPKLLDEFLRRTDGVFVHGPSAVGILPGSNARNMTVGGSKGSISGNWAMEHAELVVSIGARAVCQWDCSGTAWKNARAFIAINTRAEDAAHYNKTLPLVGDAQLVLSELVRFLREADIDKSKTGGTWVSECQRKREEWDSFRARQYEVEALFDAKWRTKILTQPAAIKTVVAFADRHNAVKYFDAGDVQANGFQIIEDEEPGWTITDTGASYMGFAVSAILSSAFADSPEYSIAFSGDGSFMMSPQVLIDAVEHKLRGMVVLFDNRRMAAISSLQLAQYGHEFRTDDSVEVDYVALARSVRGINGLFGGYTRADLETALEKAYPYEGLSFIHVPVYGGSEGPAGLGVYGAWNVGPWCDEVQREKHRLGF